MHPNLLHVVTCVSNPLRWKSRIELYRSFERHMLESGVRLTIVECALGERPFELDGNPLVDFVGVRHATFSFNMQWSVLARWPKPSLGRARKSLGSP
jgi:hypothetical protein